MIAPSASPGSRRQANVPRAGGFWFYWLRPGPVRDFGTERALAEPLGPNTGNFPSSSTSFTLLTELNLTVPKACPEAHKFDFIGIRTLFDCGWALFGNRVAGKRPRGSQCILNTG